MADYGLRGAYFPDDYWTDGSYSYWPICIILAYIMAAAAFVDQAVTAVVDRITDIDIVAQVTGETKLGQLVQMSTDRIAGVDTVTQATGETQPDRLAQTTIDGVAGVNDATRATDATKFDQLVQTSVKRLGQ